MIVFVDTVTQPGEEAGDAVPREEVLCATTHVEVMLWKCCILGGGFANSEVKVNRV